MLSTNKYRNLKLDKGNSDVFVVIAAGGAGHRFSRELPKQFCVVDGEVLIRRTVRFFLSFDFVSGIVCVIPQEFKEKYNDIFLDVTDCRLLPPVFGGKHRQRSVYNGLRSIAAYTPRYVIIHDAVRCFCRESIVLDIMKSLEFGAKAVIPIIQPVDSVRLNGKNVDKSVVKLAQTPQGFHFETIYALHDKYKNLILSDDASLCDLDGIDVDIIEGDVLNRKITFASDINREIFKTGFGFDVHKFSDDVNRKLYLMGREIQDCRGLIGVSDADVGIHSLVDAILGAIAENSIGEHFPTNDPKYKNADSKIFLRYCSNLLIGKRATVVNTDTTIVCESPSIRQYSSDMKKIVADCLGIDESSVNIKGKTTEGLGFEGRGDGISAYSIVTVKQIVT
ncbi:MAG: 2-C-methyl-D-erythritol 2,4-cyclodiphosphate synthase [Holosporales bacterium]|jgi:2-C-methyl-D-erythritol 4-phosphate cytidylyltransferase/2-C-methyl-D-erythritol 2,4-cyclodiphosphate synthase|nr:2-C-methyl-D-erythritol 2,4-cyclodiphosphate synthase [Holosporales bacterium]